ncbi:MAG TPA: amino acid racemase [Pyrinomonadaceae bacterium]|jgi:aspartate racemase|nr:amino acid racemase [Pyrinomonadaceae bacterium]
MKAAHGGNILGVVGGMGPLASAEFLKTIYECSLGEREQDAPIVVLSSDPTFPDRTSEFLRGSYDELLGRLTEALHRLRELGASKMVICCITCHHLLPRLPPELRRQVVSLLDVIFERVLRAEGRHLLICTNGARRMELFESHPSWGAASRFVVLPDDDDQQLIHELIYHRIKRNRDVRALLPTIGGLLRKYDAGSFIAGCTEIHLPAKQFECSDGYHKGYGCVDPLTIIAKEIAKGRL